MTPCLDEQQIEEVLTGQADEAMSAHLALCPACRQRRAEAEAIRLRLRAAFGSVHVSAELAERVRRSTVGGVGGEAGRPAPGEAAARSVLQPGRWVRRHWAPVAVAASLLAAAGLAVIVAEWGWPESANAAASELVSIHESNLAGSEELMKPVSHQETTAYLARELGYAVAVPRNADELRLRGCCIARFLGRKAGSMVVDGPRGPVSLIVAEANASSLQAPGNIVRGERTFWVCPMKGYFTVAVQQDKLIYCAVGAEQPDKLVDLLVALLDRPRGRE